MQNVLTKILINSAVGLILIFIWSRFVNIPEIVEHIKGADPSFIVFFLLLFAFSGFLKGIRFKILLSKFKIPLKDLVMLHYLSQLLSFMIPIRVGEMTKSVYLTTEYNLPLGKTLIWVFVDRAVDLFVTLSFAGIFLLLVPSNLPAAFSQIIFVVLTIMGLTSIAFILNEKLFKNITQKISNYLIIPKIKSTFLTLSHTVIEGVGILNQHPIRLITILFLTSLGVLTDSLIWVLGFRSLGFNLDFSKSILGDALTALGYLIPAAPGYVGSTEAGALAIFSGILGINNNLVSAVSVIFHLLTIVAVLIFGVTSLYFLKINLSSVWKRILKKE